MYFSFFFLLNKCSCTKVQYLCTYPCLVTVTLLDFVMSYIEMMSLIDTNGIKKKTLLYLAMSLHMLTDQFTK